MAQEVATPNLPSPHVWNLNGSVLMTGLLRAWQRMDSMPSPVWLGLLAMVQRALALALLALILRLRWRTMTAPRFSTPQEEPSKLARPAPTSTTSTLRFENGNRFAIVT